MSEAAPASGRARAASAGGLDPEVHGVETDEASAGALLVHLSLQVWLDVAEE
jgi:hypothetical protein